MTVMLLQNNVCVYSHNNNNNNNVSKSGPSTIEDQFRQHLNKNGPAEREGRPRLNVFSLPHTGTGLSGPIATEGPLPKPRPRQEFAMKRALPQKNCHSRRYREFYPPDILRGRLLGTVRMLQGGKRQGKAMNYYRLWIYTCNAVLLISVLGFIVVAGKVVVIDPRRTLIPGLTLHEPSLLYAYLALLTQSGLLQLLGCIGALRLNERLLNMYWFLLLFLLFGDAFIGVVWIFRFDKMYTDLKPILRQRLQMEYGVNEEFTNVWDGIQHDFSCCGVEGPQDFNEMNLSRKNDTRENRRNGSPLRYEDSDRNRVTANRSVGPRDHSKGYATVTTSDESPTEGIRDVEVSTNSFFFTTASTSSASNEPFLKDPSTKYVRNVPESCCRVLTEDVPNEDKVEKQEEPQSKPTAIRQRLEKKKSRHQENKVSKRSASDDVRLGTPQTPQRGTLPPHEASCKGSRTCKGPTKRHAYDNKAQFRNGHVRHESLYRSTHHYSTSANVVPSNATNEKRPKEPKYSTGNFRIMETCANANGRPGGTTYGMSETLHFSIGCEVKLKKWLRDSAHVLGVLGYCVIAFLKLCFLGILRYEIREMIQKIKMLQSEQQPPVLLLRAESPNENLEANSPNSDHNLCNHVDGGMPTSNAAKNPSAVPRGEGEENPDRLRANSLGNALLLLQPPDSAQTTPVHHTRAAKAARQGHRLYNSILGGDAGNDSDTNSHCALLIDGDEGPPGKNHSRGPSNGNNNCESHELQDLLARRSPQI